jgi:hypothetical protein
LQQYILEHQFMETHDFQADCGSGVISRFGYPISR